MTSPVDVANMALDNIGAGLSITSLVPPAPAPNANVVARHYQPKIDALFRAAHWNCARVQGSLSLIKAALGTPENPNGTTLPIPPVPWTYEYLVPLDCLAVRYLIPNPPRSTGTNPPIYPGNIGLIQRCFAGTAAPFVVGSDLDQLGNRVKVILTDLEYADLVYTGRIDNPDLWDSHFLLAGTATLGAWLCNPVNMNQAILKGQIEIASSIVTQARISDGNEGLTSVDHRPDWMQVRDGTSFWGGPPGLGQAYYGWSTLGFPGGAFV